MALGKERGAFFEAENPPINQRRWPHFMDFYLLDYFDLKNLKFNRHLYGKRGDLSDTFSDSANNGGGTPAPLRNSQWETLIDNLRLQKKITNSNNS